MKNNFYKAGQPRYSEYHKTEVCDIFLRKRFLGISYWCHHSTIFNRGQVDEVVYLMNNPDIADLRIKEAVQKLKLEGKP